MSDDKTVTQNAAAQPEPWLRGTLQEVSAVPRGVLHALELANEDLQKWCGGLSDAELNSRPAGLPPVAFHLRHIARSLDRLLTVCGRPSVKSGASGGVEGRDGNWRNARGVICGIGIGVGRKREASARTREGEFGRTSRGWEEGAADYGCGLLVHVADHTQRHVGQAITTAKIILAQRG
jgi:hypothetical protein